MDDARNWEVYAVRYASLEPRDASQLFVHYGLSGSKDHQLGMDCFIWVIRNRSKVVVVDSGYRAELGLTRLSGRQRDYSDPVELLRELDITPGDVDHVIISHMHFDHTGNLARFPSATFSVAAAELDYWNGPYSDRPAVSYHTDSTDVQVINDLDRDGRVQALGPSAEILPGIAVTEVGGHSPGQQIIEVSTAGGSVVLASDAIHYHAELERDLAFWVHTDLIEMFAAYDRLRDLAARPDARVVSGHDPLEMARFERVGERCIDLTQPLS